MDFYIIWVFAVRNNKVPMHCMYKNESEIGENNVFNGSKALAISLVVVFFQLNL